MFVIKKTNCRLSNTNFVFHGQTENCNLGTTLKIPYFVVKERMTVDRMAVWMKLLNFLFCCIKNKWPFGYLQFQLTPLSLSVALSQIFPSNKIKLSETCIRWSLFVLNKVHWHFVLMSMLYLTDSYYTQRELETSCTLIFLSDKWRT